MPTPNPSSFDYGCQIVTVCRHCFTFEPNLPIPKAGVIITVQVQLLTSDWSSTDTIIRALLAFGLVLELLSIVLATCLAQYTRKPNLPPSESTFIRLTRETPIVLILVGILSLAAAFITEMRHWSLASMIVMSGMLVLGLALCSSILWKLH